MPGILRAGLSPRPMLVIRPEQIAVFERHAREQFRERMLRRFAELYPEELAGIPESEREPWMEGVIARAERNGFETEYQVTLFADLALFFGAHFDEDPRQPWAREILADPFLLDAELRCRTLHERGLEQLRVAGAPSGAKP